MAGKGDNQCAKILLHFICLDKDVWLALVLFRGLSLTSCWCLVPSAEAVSTPSWVSLTTSSWCLLIFTVILRPSKSPPPPLPKSRLSSMTRRTCMACRNASHSTLQPGSLGSPTSAFQRAPFMWVGNGGLVWIEGHNGQENMCFQIYPLNINIASAAGNICLP